MTEAVATFGIIVQTGLLTAIYYKLGGLVKGHENTEKRLEALEGKCYG